MSTACLFFPQYVFVMCMCELPAFIGGSRDPGLVCHISSKSLVADSDEKIKTYFPKLFAVLKQATQLSGDRCVKRGLFV